MTTLPLSAEEVAAQRRSGAGRQSGGELRFCGRDSVEANSPGNKELLIDAEIKTEKLKS